MKQPIKRGDRAVVIGGLGRHKSPNLGLTVEVGQCFGEHSMLGRVWHCTNPEIKQLTDSGGYVVTGEADFAQSWLRKIEPDALPAATVEKAETV